MDILCISFSVVWHLCNTYSTRCQPENECFNRFESHTFRQDFSSDWNHPKCELICVFTVQGRPTEEDGELVMVRELGDHRLKRSTESLLPSHLHTNFRIGGDVVSLRLVRNAAIDTNISFTFVKNKREKIYIPDREVYIRLLRCYFITWQLSIYVGQTVPIKRA